jgi:hypothetical protein
MSVGGLIDLKWVVQQRTQCGTVCSFQGALNIIGVTTAAWFTMAITVHTWLSVYRNRRMMYQLPVWLGFSAAVWLYIILFAVIGHFVKQSKGESFFTPAPLCECLLFGFLLV